MEKLILSWDRWNNITPNNFQLRTIESKHFLYDSTGYEINIYEINKTDRHTIHDFVCQCYIILSGHIDDLIDPDDNRLIYKHLTPQEFVESIKKVPFKIRWWQKPIIRRLPKLKIINILVIFEWWDWSTYIIEYENKWVFLSLSIQY